MKKELVIHLFFLLLFFVPIALLKRYFEPIHLLFLLGGIVGTILPDIDHLIYVYYLQPHELSSQRIQNAVGKTNLSSTLHLLYSTRSERKNLIFHSSWFQILFMIVTFWVMTSSLNLFGKGLVLAFSLHLIVDQFVDLTTVGNLDTWFSQFQFRPIKEKALFYVLGVFLVLIVLGFLF